MSKRPHFVVSLVSAISLLLASNTAQAGSFFSFQFSFDNYGGYYHPYRYVYAPSYYSGWPYYDWPYFYGHTYYHPVTYVYYPSVFYRPIFPYRYPYYAYHPHRHRHHHWNHHSRYYDYRYSHSYPRTSTHVYGYHQPRKTYYHAPKNHYKKDHGYDNHNKRYDKRGYEQHRFGESPRRVNNQLATARLEERFRRERESERFQAAHNSHNERQLRQRSISSRQPDRTQVESDTRQYTFNAQRRDNQINNTGRRDVKRGTRELRQPQERNINLNPRAEQREPRRINGQNREATRAQREQPRDSGMNANRRLAKNDFNPVERVQRPAAQREEKRERREAATLARSSERAQRNENRNSMSSRSSMSNRGGLEQRNSFRGNPGTAGGRNR